MLSMEIIRRDGPARICSFDTPHGRIVTPNLFPVINPNINLLSMDEIRRCGADTIITNGYIIRRDQSLRERALNVGVHSLLGFDGPIMTDSGTFQTYVYGDMEYGNTDMVEFQRSIGSDIATIVDVFSVPSDSREQAKYKVVETARRFGEIKGEGILAAPVQGSLYPDLRRLSAKLMTDHHPDYYAIGGVVPLLESYRYEDLVRIISVVKMNIDPSKPLHLFGAGHPMFLPLAVLMGIDLFDSASYAKYARENRLLFPDGTRDLSEVAEFPWWSTLSSYGNRELLGMDEKDRIRLLTMHNLRSIFHEIREIREHIREENLMEYVESRCRSNPLLWSAFMRLLRRGIDPDSYPLSRSGPFYYFDRVSRMNPVIRYLRSFSRGMFMSSRDAYVIHPSLWERIRNSNESIQKLWETTHGDLFFIWNGIAVPLGLHNTYPIQQNISPYIGVYGKIPSFPVNVKVIRNIGRDSIRHDSFETSMLNLVARYQFGLPEDALMFSENSTVRVSRKTGRVRTVSLNDRILATLRASDGLLVLTLEGGKLLSTWKESEYLSVWVSDESAEFNSQGRNVFSKFVVKAGSNIRPKSEVLVFNGDSLIAVGKALMNGREMMHFRRGIAVEVRQGKSRPEPDEKE